MSERNFCPARETNRILERRKEGEKEGKEGERESCNSHSNTNVNVIITASKQRLVYQR